MPLVLTQGSVTLTLKPHSIGKQRKGKNKVVPIPNDDPITIPLGREGPTFKIEARVDATEFAHSEALVIGDNVTVAAGTTHEEFTSFIGSAFYLDDVREVRKAGQNDEWDIMVQMTRNYSA